MANRLFYENSYIDECVSNVTDVIEKDGRILVVLDITPFYPEGGGQPSDLGTIDDCDVTHVFEDQDIIYHVVDRKPDSKAVKCKVDFTRRFDHMQQHSGEHLLSAAFFKLYKGVNCGFHMGEDYVTIDINLSEITEEMIKRVEEEVNDYVYRNLEVYTYIVSKGETENLPLRKEVKVEGNIRIVQMGDVDYSACCGTHVVRTGEIGAVKVTKTEKYKGMTRIYFKCGKRALADYMNKHDITALIGKHLSVDEGGILSKIETQTVTIKELNRKLSETRRSLAEYDAKELMNSALSNIVEKVFEDKSSEDIQNIMAVLENEAYITILGSLPDKKVMIGHNGSFNVSCGKVFKEMLPSFKGKGGGNEKKAQAAFSTEEDLLNFVNDLSKRIR